MDLVPRKSEHRSDFLEKSNSIELYRLSLIEGVSFYGSVHFIFRTDLINQTEYVNYDYSLSWVAG
jgi:hypothetical protein